MLRRIYFCALTLFTISLVHPNIAEISNNIETSLSRDNLPKPVQYFNFPPTDEPPPSTDKPQNARFAYPVGTNIEGYGSNALTHPFYPFKFDLGGLLLGAAVGFGALLLVPKLAHILGPSDLPSYGPPYTPSYGRSADEPHGFTHIISEVDKLLAESNINSSECLQKAICSYVQSSRSQNGRQQSTTDSTAADSTAADNTLSSYVVNFLTDGSKFKSAIENGKQDVGCSILYPKCPFNQESIVNGVKHLMLKNTTELN